MTPRVFLGFDYGEKFIGVAVGGSHTRSAQPLTTVPAAGGEPDWRRVTALIEDWRPQALVVGLPLNMDASPNPLTRAARAFGQRLKDRYNLAVHMVDERLSSRAAKQTLYEAGISARRHKPHLDKLSAQLILQAFLDELKDAPDGH